LGADVISSDEPLLCVDDLADQIAEVLDFFGYVEHRIFKLSPIVLMGRM